MEKTTLATQTHNHDFNIFYSKPPKSLWFHSSSSVPDSRLRLDQLLLTQTFDDSFLPFLLVMARNVQIRWTYRGGLEEWKESGNTTGTMETTKTAKSFCKVKLKRLERSFCVFNFSKLTVFFFIGSNTSVDLIQSAKQNLYLYSHLWFFPLKSPDWRMSIEKL